MLETPPDGNDGMELDEMELDDDELEELVAENEILLSLGKRKRADDNSDSEVEGTSLDVDDDACVY